MSANTINVDFVLDDGRQIIATWDQAIAVPPIDARLHFPTGKYRVISQTWFSRATVVLLVTESHHE